MVNLPSWVLFYRDCLYTRETSTNNRIERHNRELKTKLSASEHLVEAVKNITEFAYFNHQQYVSQSTCASIKFNKVYANEYELIKQYHKLLTSSAIILLRQEQSKIDEILANYIIRSKRVNGLRTFIFKSRNGDSSVPIHTVSTDHDRRIQCTCKFFHQHKLACKHIMIIFEGILLKKMNYNLL